MKISNIVATVALKERLDIAYLHKKIKGTIRDPKVHWLKYRIPKDNSYVAFYQSGKFLITAKSMEQVDQNVNTILTILDNIGISIIDWKLVIHNLVIVDSLVLGCTIEKLVTIMDSKKASFEPEQFPALIYKDWGVTFLLFSSGKVVITGANSIDQAKKASIKFKQLITYLS
jgi:transcription initiation factor TFIID TATA-box-binding protein